MKNILKIVGLFIILYPLGYLGCLIMGSTQFPPSKTDLIVFLIIDIAACIICYFIERYRANPKNNIDNEKSE